MTQAWSIYVELGRRDAPDDLYEDLYEHLAAAAPSVGTAPNGNLSVRVFVEASTIRQAIDAGLKTVTAAAKSLSVTEPVVGVEAITEEELDRRNAEPVIPPLVGVSEIAELLGVTRGRATQLTNRDDFPPAVATLKSSPIFVREQVEAFGRTWDRRGGRPLKPVTLKGPERELLAALRIARNARAHGQDVDLEQIREQINDHTVGLWRHLHSVAGSPRELSAVALRYDAAKGVHDALAALRRLHLITVENVEEGHDEASVDVTLTSKGERVPIA